MLNHTIVQCFRTGNSMISKDETNIYIYKIKSSINEVILLVSQETVERIRNNHLNDWENVIQFVLIDLVYVSIRLKFDITLRHCRIFFYVFHIS